MNSNLINITAITRSAFVVPFHGFGMGDVCPQVDYLAMNSAKRRSATVKATVQATAWATPGSGQPWSPPVT